MSKQKFHVSVSECRASKQKCRVSMSECRASKQKCRASKQKCRAKYSAARPHSRILNASGSTTHCRTAERYTTLTPASTGVRSRSTLKSTSTSPPMLR